MSGACALCRHAHSHVAADKSIQRVCRRYPPQVSVVTVPVQGMDGRVGVNAQVMSLFPVIDDAASCGEFAPSLSS